jgi:uncharacterized protein with FMN-binding domain
MRRVIATVVGTVISLVLLLSFKTHSLTSSSNAATPPVVTPSSAPPSDSSDLTVPSTTPSSAPAASGSTTTTAPKPTTTKKATSTASRTVQGDAVDTRYGPVQVSVVLAGTKITAINILQVPDQERRDVEINNFAVPVLNQEALAAQSSKIDMVSGATYTSQGYLQSLQSALDKAGA